MSEIDNLKSSINELDSQMFEAINSFGHVYGQYSDAFITLKINKANEDCVQDYLSGMKNLQAALNNLVGALEYYVQSKMIEL